MTYLFWTCRISVRWIRKICKCAIENTSLDTFIVDDVSEQSGQRHAIKLFDVQCVSTVMQTEDNSRYYVKHEFVVEMGICSRHSVTFDQKGIFFWNTIFNLTRLNSWKLKSHNINIKQLKYATMIAPFVEKVLGCFFFQKRYGFTEIHWILNIIESVFPSDEKIYLSRFRLHFLSLLIFIFHPKFLQFFAKKFV